MFLKTLYVLFFVHLETRRLLFTAVTENPNGEWVAQQARNLGAVAPDLAVRFVVRDRDAKFTSTFDTIFTSAGSEVIKAPIRSPKANAFAERIVRTIRAEILDWILIFGRRHLEGILREYVAHYNGERPHRSLGLRPPIPRPLDDRPPSGSTLSRLGRRDRLGGLIHEYYSKAA